MQQLGLISKKLNLFWMTKKQIPKVCIVYCSIYICHSWNDKIIDLENRLVVAEDKVVGRDGRKVLIRVVIKGQDERFL